MPFTDPVSSISGRNSRASNVSAATGASRSMRSAPPMGTGGGDTLANAGVLSMLKTSTDTGDIGALSFNNARLPSMPHRGGQRRQHPSRMSGSSHPHPGGHGSHNYAPSMTSRVSSNAREWDTASNGRRGSMTSMQTMPTFVSDTQPSFMSGHGRPMGLGPPPPAEMPGDSRSYSLTNAISASQLPRHRSANSLKSQGHEPRRYNGPPPPMPENRGPFVYPTRLKRPGYRSPSPALSDSYSQGLPPPLPLQNPARRHQGYAAPPMPRPPMPTYNSDYGPDYPMDPAYLNVPPPVRGMSNSPVMGYEQAPPQTNYAPRPGQMRYPPPMPMQYPGHRVPPVPQVPQMYAPPRPVYAQTPYPPQQHQQHVRRPAPQQQPQQHPSAGPMAHHIFHNAARMARQMPQRTDTPMTDNGPPSSDPPSSGSAPTVSSPPTPRDQSEIQVAVDPAFVDPALTDLPESTSEPVIPAKYFDYIDGLERVIDESEVEVHHPSVPPSGFVQRVKAMLESRAAVEAAVRRDEDRDYDRLPVERQIESHDFAAPHATRVTVLEEFNAPVELPASPVMVAELPASPVHSMRRLTREFVKDGLNMSITELENSRVSATPTKDHTPSPLKPAEQQSPEGSPSAFEPSSLDDENTQDVEVPSSPPNIQHKSSVTKSIHSTDDQSTTSGIDFGLHLSPPSDTEATATDLGETETESGNPFALDADTITAQQQGAKDTILRSIQTDFPSQPVSPLLPGQTVNRFSAVSPINTQMNGIDETMIQPDKESADGGDEIARDLMPGAFPNENQPPPTPRTPRVHSKSVHLPQPSPSFTETTNSNRLSLPADLSQIGDTTINSNTDAMTDVAVRFSMPQTTITIGKPQIVSIPSSNTPPKHEAATLKSALHGPERERRHGSIVTFEDEVAPLKVNKKVEQHRQSHSLGSIAPRVRSQVSRGPSPFEEQAESDRASRDSTTDMRFSGINFIRNKYPSTHLPGLKEESSEDMSVNDYRRSTDIANGLQFQLPARIAAVKAMQERRQQELEDKEKMRRAPARRHPEAGRPLGDTRDLPSLNFSRMDLIDKLNDALQIRPAKSMDVVRRRDFSAIYCPSPQRPQSTEPLWDRYTSFFNKPEDFGVEDEESLVSDEETEEIAGDPESRRQSRALSDSDCESRAVSRPLSPEEHMLHVAGEVNRLSIPSVNGLSERLSELLPSLRNLNLDSVLANDREVAHTIDNIHLLGKLPATRPDTVLSTRTSAGFRTLAERAEEIVRFGTHDSVVPYRALAINKELPPLPVSASLDQVPILASADGHPSYLSGSVSAPSGLLERPASALIRTKSPPMTQEEVLALLPPEGNPIARASKRSLVVSSLSSRPWNLDENYPWAGSNLAIDLMSPEQAHQRETLARELARRRGTKSLDLTSSGDLLGNTTSGIDIGSIHTDLDGAASVTTEQLTGVSSSARKHSKRSIFGSIKYKIGLSRNNNHADETTRTTLPTSPATQSTDEPTAHNPGDRYPSTALTPPLGFNLDEVRSYFSDDSSDGNKDRKTPKGRRWTGLKSKTRPNTAQSRRQSFDDSSLPNHAYDAGLLNEQQHLGFDTSVSYPLEGVGMGKTEFRIKRFGEKLRVLFAKGGDLVRSLSTRSKNKKALNERDDWLSDSLYSGV